MIHGGPPFALLGTTAFIDLGLPALATAVALRILRRFAPELGLVDRGGGHGLHREPDARGKCLIGGLGLAFGLAVSAALPTAVRSLGPFEFAALFLALCVGWFDDRSQAGVSARAKLFCQFLPALAFALGAREQGLYWMAAYLCAAIAAQNLANTYDNADGVLLLTAAIAFAPSRPTWSALALVVLAFNLRWRAPANVLLGDSGSHLIAILLLCEPRAWGAFLLPALDLARVVVVRHRQRRPWWVGDRVHLAHRLAARGLGPSAVALALALAALPAIATGAFAHGLMSWCLGICGSAAAFAFLVRATPAVDGRGVGFRDTRSALRPAGADREP